MVEGAEEEGEVLITSAHLLLGVIREPNEILASVFVDAGVEADQIHKAIEPLVYLSPVRANAFRLSPDGVDSIDRTMLEALMIGNVRVGPEHLFLGLVGDPSERVGQVLRSLGFDLKRSRSVVHRLQPKSFKEWFRRYRLRTWGR